MKIYLLANNQFVYVYWKQISSQTTLYIQRNWTRFFKLFFVTKARDCQTIRGRVRDLSFQCTHPPDDQALIPLKDMIHVFYYDRNIQMENIVFRIFMISWTQIHILVLNRRGFKLAPHATTYNLEITKRVTFKSFEKLHNLTHTWLWNMLLPQQTGPQGSICWEKHRICALK